MATALYHLSELEKPETKTRRYPKEKLRDEQVKLSRTKRLANHFSPHGDKRRDIIAQRAAHAAEHMLEVSTDLQPDRFATGQIRSDQEYWLTHVASPDILRPRRVKEMRQEAFAEAVRSGLTDEQAARRILAGEFIEIDHTANQHDVADVNYHPVYLAPETFADHFGVSESEWQRTVFRDAIIEGKLRIAGVGQETVTRESLIPHHVITQFKDMLAKSDEQLDDMDRGWSAKRSWETSVDYADILDPKNVLFLREKIAAELVRGGVRKGDAEYALQSGDGLTANMQYMARYFGMSVENWHRQVVTHEIHIIPDEVLAKFKDLLQLPKTALQELARFHRGIPGPDGRVHAPSETTGARGRIHQLEEELARALGAPGAHSASGKSIEQQLSEAQKNVLNITGHEARLQDRLDRYEDHVSRNHKRAEQGWPLHSGLPLPVDKLLAVDALVDEENKRRQAEGLLDKDDPDYGAKSADLRLELYRQEFNNPSLTAADAKLIYQDINDIKDHSRADEIKSTIDKARDLVIDTQQGSEWLILKKIPLIREVDGKNGKRKVKVNLTDRQTEYIMNMLEVEGVVGPQLAGPGEPKQARQVL